MSLATLHDAVAAVAPIDGLTEDGEIWFKPEATEEQKAVARAAFAAFDGAKADLIAHANQKHNEVLNGGVTISGVPVSTTTDGRVSVAGAVSLAQLVPNHVFDWVTDTGKISLDANTIIGLGQQVGLWVQTTYTALGNVMDEIETGAITSNADIDAYSWPTNQGT